MNRYLKSDFIYYIPWLFISTLMLWLVRGDKYLAILTLIMLVITIITNKKITIQNKDYWILITMVTFVFFQALQSIYSIGGRESRSLIVATIFLATFPFHKITSKYISAFLTIFSISCLFFVVNYQYITPLNRFYWPVNAIPAATCIALVSCLSFALLFNEKFQTYRLQLLLSFTLSTISVFMSESRGVILALISTIAVLLLVKIVNSKIKITAKSIITSLALVSIMLISSYPLLKERVLETKEEILNIQSENLNTSIGYRIQAYKIAIDIFEEYPILGIGNPQKRIDELFKEKRINAGLHRVLSWNFHNNFLNTMANQGLVGLAFLLILIFYPIYRAYKHDSSLSYAIASVPLLYFFASLTDTPFTNGHSFVLYLIIVGSLLILSNKEPT